MKTKTYLMRGLIAAFLVLVVVPVVSERIHAQELAGAIVGTVVDPSGKPIPAAALEVRNVATQVTRSIATDMAGLYEAAGLLPGDYQISVKAAGFERRVVENVSVAFGARVRVDIPLAIGQEAISVSVTAVPSPIETDTARISETLNTKKVLDLPYNNTLGTLNLIRFMPGTYPQSAPYEYTGNGLGNTEINQSFDGISVNNENGGLSGSYYFSPSLDAVQEVSYVEMNQSAENPFATTYSVITKSGGPSYHGSLYEYMTNNSWNARNFFATTAPTGKLNHLFGGTVSGPVIKNRLFFFVDIQQQRNTVLQQYNLLVPTDKVRGGDFSGLAAIHDPTSGIPYPNNIIPAAQISPTANKLLDFYYQQPNTPLNQNFGFFNQTANRSQSLQHYNFRFDQRITDKQSLMVRFTRQLYDDHNGLAPANPAWGDIVRNDPSWFLSVSHTHALTSRLLNEARLGYNDSPDGSSGQLKGGAVVQQLGLQGLGSLPDVATVPSLSVAGIATMTGPRVPVRDDKIWNISEAVTWIHSVHTVKAGFLIRPMELYQQLPEPQNLFGSVSFNGAFSGMGVSDFLLGLPQTTTTSLRADNLNRKITQYHWFVQDDIRLTPKLTVNIGLRYELNPSPRETNYGELYLFDRSNGKIVVPGQAQLDLINPAVKAVFPIELASTLGLPTNTLIDQRNWLWYPRVGLAYRPFGNGNTVFRAGYGMYAIDQANLYAPTSGYSSGGVYASTLSFINSVSPTGALFRLPQIFPAGTSGPPIAVGALSLNSQDPQRSTPYSQQWNITAEHMLNGKTSLRVSYAGNKSTHLPVFYNINQPVASTLPFDQSRRPYPLYSTVTWNEFRGNGIYHGLTAVLSRRFSNGLMFDATYLWARNLDDAFTYVGGNIQNSYNQRPERGNDPFTPRQRFAAQLICQIPYGHGRPFGSHTSLLADRILGGWQISSVTVIQTGTFFTPTYSGADPTNTATFGGRTQVVGDWQIPSGQRILQRWFNPAAFAIPQNGTFGNAGPYSMQGPGRWGEDMGVYKEVSLGESRVFRVEATAIDIFNHPNFSNPVSDITSPAVGQITSTNGIEGGSGRTIQLGFRFRF